MTPEEYEKVRWLLIRADSLLGLAIYRGESAETPLWRSEADYLLSEIRKYLKK